MNRMKRFFGNLGVILLLIAGLVAWMMLPWTGVLAVAIIVALWLAFTRSGRPSGPFSMPASALMSGVWSRVITELVSACEPPRRMIAVSSPPVLSSVALKPSPIASIATSTPTTPAMPITITEEAPHRCGRPAMPMRVAVSARRPLRVSVSHKAPMIATARTPSHGSSIQATSPATSSRITPRFPKKRFVRFM